MKRAGRRTRFEAVGMTRRTSRTPATGALAVMVSATVLGLTQVACVLGSREARADIKRFHAELVRGERLDEVVAKAGALHRRRARFLIETVIRPDTQSTEGWLVWHGEDSSPTPEQVEAFGARVCGRESVRIEFRASFEVWHIQLRVGDDCRVLQKSSLSEQIT
jgi:hypothetical protein